MVGNYDNWKPEYHGLETGFSYCPDCDGEGGGREGGGWTCLACEGRGAVEDADQAEPQDEYEDLTGQDTRLDAALEAEVLEEREALLQLDVLTCLRCGGLLCDCDAIEALRSGKVAA